MTLLQVREANAGASPEPNWANGPSRAIALLIDLAQRGEIDPWDVRVIDAIDRCLSELAILAEAQEGFGMADLSLTGQAFVDASLLVLLKANTLDRLESPEENLEAEVDPEWSDLEDWADSPLPRNLEQKLKRRPTAQPPSSRRVTLQELIEQLQLVAAAIEGKPRRTRPSDRRSQSRSQVMRAALELVREENSMEIASELDRFLASYFSELSCEENWLDIEQLLLLWAQQRHQETGKQKQEDVAFDSPDRALPHLADDSVDLASSHFHLSPQEQLHDRVGIFWALLLLSAQSKVELVQEEFYQDLKIRAIL